MLQDANTSEEAVKQLTDSGCKQPLLFRFTDRMWLKLDNTAVAVPAASVTDAFEQLLQYFFIMNVEYPQELWLSYIFIERVLGLKATVAKSMQLAEFFDEVTE